MSELFRIVLTSSLTILGGIAVIVGGQIIIKFFIAPIHEQSRIVGQIAESLVFYANTYMNPGIGNPDKMDEAVKALRLLASKLVATTHAIRLYGFWQSIGIIPRWADVIEASKQLIGLSNSIHRGDVLRNDGRRKEIRKRLRIETYV